MRWEYDVPVSGCAAVGVADSGTKHHGYSKRRERGTMVIHRACLALGDNPCQCGRKDDEAASLQRGGQRKSIDSQAYLAVVESVLSALSTSSGVEFPDVRTLRALQSEEGGPATQEVDPLHPSTLLLRVHILSPVSPVPPLVGRRDLLLLRARFEPLEVLVSRIYPELGVDRLQNVVQCNVRSAGGRDNGEGPRGWNWGVEENGE